VVSILDACGQPPLDPPGVFTPPLDPPGVFTPPLAGPSLVVGALGDSPPGGVAPGVPEPAAWLMMILGFGAAGSALRAQRRRAPAWT
jgi:hypothetical protein